MLCIKLRFVLSLKRHFLQTGLDTLFSEQVHVTVQLILYYGMAQKRL